MISPLVTAPRSHLFAAAVLTLGGALVGITALGLAVAPGVLAAGIPGVAVKPQDAALLDDLFAVLPFIVTFAAINLAAALGLVIGHSWAASAASWVASVAVAVGLLALVLVIVGSGVGGDASNADGLGVISIFVSLYALVALAVHVSRVPTPAFRSAASAAA